VNVCSRLACLLLLVLSLAPALPAAAAAQTADAAAVDAIVQEALKAWQVPGAAVAIVRGDAVIYLKGHGS
jgi:CubicO group peptidase (beta-lactamase class C family)